MQNLLLETKDLRKQYGKLGMFLKNRHAVSAVNGVSLQINRGSSVALIGESGSGKSTLGRLLAGLEKPTEGEVLYKGTVISSLSFHRMLPYRKKIQMIFQNSSGVFDPTYSVGYSIMEILRNTEKLNKKTYNERVAEILEHVGLDTSYALRKSDALSGGQRQRLNIARALISNPEFVVCDEPVSSLDYSLRKQILDLLNKLRKDLDLTYLFITHDITCVPYVCDRVLIMYSGQVLEQFNLDKTGLDDAVHPYTNFLIQSVPVRTPFERRNKNLSNTLEIAHVPDKKQCCRFYPRCNIKIKRCEKENPPLRYIKDSHMVLCHCL
jgi:peptide/nickel transport system ATP-binding protein